MARTIVDDSAGWVVVIRRQIWAGNSTTTGLPGAYRTGCIIVSRAQDASAQVRAWFAALIEACAANSHRSPGQWRAPHRCPELLSAPSSAKWLGGIERRVTCLEPRASRPRAASGVGVFWALLMHPWVNFVPGGRVGDRRG